MVTVEDKLKKVKTPSQTLRNQINIKSKRKRHIFKKAIELSQICHQQILIVVRDPILDTMTTFGSGSKMKGEMYTLEEAMLGLKDFREMSNK